jgi:hypothetical protein
MPDPEVTLTIVEILPFWPVGIMARERQLQPDRRGSLRGSDYTDRSMLKTQLNQ